MNTLKSRPTTSHQWINIIGHNTINGMPHKIQKVWEWAISHKKISLSNSQPRETKLKGCHQDFSKKGIKFQKLSTIMVGRERKCLTFGRVDTVKFGIQILEPSTWTSHEKLHRLTFIHKYKCPYLPANKFEKCTLARAFMIKYDCQDYSAKQFLCILDGLSF